MRKVKNKKNENDFVRKARIKGEIGAVLRTEARRFIDENEKFAIYAVIGSVQVHIEEFKKYFEVLTQDQVKKIERLEKSCFGFLDKIKSIYEVTEENVKTGFLMYTNLMRYYNERQKPVVDLNPYFEEEKDAKRFYVELNYAVKIIEACLKDTRTLGEEIKKYFHYWNLQARAVINIIEKEIESNTRFNFEEYRKNWYIKNFGGNYEKRRL